MRRITGFAAVLLAAGVLGGPVWAQSLPGGQNLDYMPQDPVVPLPLGHARMESVGGFFTAGEFIMYRQTNTIKHQLIAVRGFTDVDGAITGDLNGTVVNSDTDVPFIIRGPLVPGTLYGSRDPALFTDDLKGQESFQPGWALSMGYKFDSGSKIELKWQHVNRQTYTANASSVPNLGQVGPLTADSFLFANVFNYAPEFAGALQETAIGNPGSLTGIWNGAINMTIAFQQGFDQVDIIGSVPWFQNDVCRVYGRAGGRFAWIFERFTWRTVSADFNGNSTDADVANYSNTVSNRMYGPAIGLGVDRYIGYGFSIALESDVAGLLDVARLRAKYVRGDKEIETKQSINQFQFSPMVNANVNLYWYPFEGVQIRAGYNFAAFFNTIEMGDPISFDFRAIDPDWGSRGVRFLDGFNAGIGFIF